VKGLLRLVAVLAVSTGAMGCAAQSEALMYEKASALTKLSSAAEAVLLYSDLPLATTDVEILRSATQGTPDLLREFDAYTLRVGRHHQGVVLLVCEANGGVALLEDASCTAKMDRHHWRDFPGGACAFTLQMPNACEP
jgi:hypothetical protein